MRLNFLSGRPRLAGAFVLLAAILLAWVPDRTAEAAIAVSKSIAPGFSGTILPGDITAFRITLTNDNPVSSVNNAAFTDDMTVPAITVAGGAVTNNTCGGTVTAGLGSSTIVLANGVIPIAPGGGSLGTCNIDVQVTSTAAGTAPVNTIPAGAVTGNDGAAQSNGSPAVQSFTVLTLARPTLAKSFTPATVVQNDQVSTLRLVINNPNAGAELPLTTVTDALPAGMQVAAAPNASVTCTGTGAVNNSVFAPAAGANSLTITGGTVGRSGSCTIAVDVIGTSAGVNGSQVLTNTLLASNVGNTRGLTPTANASANLTVNSPLRVAKAFAPNPMRAGQAGTLTITLRNDSPTTDLTSVAFTDNPIGRDPNTLGAPPAPGKLAVSAPVSPACGGVVAAVGTTGVSFSGGTIPANNSCIISVPFIPTLTTAGTPQDFLNTLPASAVSNAQGVVSGAASATVRVNDRLTVSKAVSPATIAPGNLVTYTVTVRNFTGSAQPGTSFPDALPGGILAVASPAPAISGAGCVNFSANLAAAARPVFNFDMPAGTSGNPGGCTITFSAQVPVNAAAGTPFNNTLIGSEVCAGAVCSTANSNTATTTTLNTAPLAKVFNPNSLSEGGVSQLTITLSNNSANPLSAVDLTDNLPSVAGPPVGQVVIANPANATTTCGGSPTITAAPGASSIRIQNASIPARGGSPSFAAGTCLLVVNVTGPAGVYTNTIPANSLIATQTLGDGTQAPATFPTAVTAPLTFAPALTATKSFSPNTIQGGGKARLTVRLSNIGSGTLNNVSFNDLLPADMTIANPANASTTCSGAPLITATPGGTTFNMTGSVLPASGLCEVLVDVTASSSANSVNTIPPGGVTAAGGVRNTTPVTATLQKSAGAVTVTKSINPNTITSPGQVSTVTLTLLNTGGIALTNVALTDFFTNTGLSGGTPTGMRVAATPNPVTTCPGGVVSAVTNATSISLAGGQLAASGAPGDSCEVHVDVTTFSVGTVQNTIPVNAVTNTQGITNSLAAVSSLATLARLGVQKAFIPPTIAPGQRARMRLTFINPLALPLTGLSVTDNLPAGLAVPAGANPTTTCVGGSVTAPTTTSVVLSGGTLPAAPTGSTTSCVAEIDVFAAAPGAFVNVIAAGSVNALAGGQPVTNQPPDVTATLQVRSPATIAKAFSPSPGATGASSTLTITINNQNTVPLTAARFVDTFPAGLAVALTPNASSTCAGAVINAAASETQISITGATIPASGSCVVRVDTVSNTAGTYTNTIPPNALTTAEGVTNDEPATAPVTFSSPPTIAKAFTPVSVPSGGVSVLTLQLGNANATAITLTAALTDTLPTVPGALVVAAPNGVGGTCPGAVTAVAGSGVITYANGASIPAGGCTINVNVTGTVNGTYNNTIPANGLQTNVGNNLQPGTADLVISPLGFISGKVFKDNNVTQNGTFENGTDVPLPNVAVTLTGTDFGPDGVLGGGDDTPVSRTVTTDALGNYAFTGLNAGSYSVTEPTQPPGTLNGITTAGTISGGGGGTPGTATGAATPSAINTIQLRRTGGVGGQVDSSPNNNFAEVATSSISGTVFLDQNNNGIQNGADTPLANVTVELLDAGGIVVATTTTDASGHYTFPDLAPGTYSVREPTQPPSTSSGMTIPGLVPNGGTVGTATAPAVTPSRISSIVLPPNTQSTGNNFAELPNGRTISGRVFVDFDNTGLLNGPDHGLGSQTLTLTGTDINGNPVTATTTTAADGSYAFTGLPEGTFTVTQPAQPVGTNNGITTPGSTGGVATGVATPVSVISAINLTGLNTISGENNFAETLGAATDLTIAKTNTPAQFAAGSSLGRYELTVTNIGTVASSGVITVTDTMPPGMAATAAPTDAPWICTLGNGGALVTCTTTTVVGPNASLPPIHVPVAIAAGLEGNSLINVATVSGGGETPGFDGNNSAADPTQLQTGATVSGKVWFNSLVTDKIQQPGEPGLPGWIVEAVRGGVVVATVTTDADGHYIFTGLPPSTGPNETYELVFRHPVTRAVFGEPDSHEPGVDLTRHTIAHLTLAPGANIVEQNLPLDPSGVVYDAVTRLPVAGATVTLVGPPGFDPATHLLGGAGNVTQVTDASGFYQFLLLPGAPAGAYTIQVTPPGGYLPTPSGILPPQPGALTVPPLPNPFKVSESAAPPPVGAPAVYFFTLNLSATSANLINNHIPLDPVLTGALTLTKTTPLVNVARGDLVPYTITARNNLASALPNIDLRDQVPPGFKYRLGSARISAGTQISLPLEPRVEGRNLTWPNQTFAANETKTLKLILVVGVGVGEGEYINQAVALSGIANTPISNIATASVRVVPDPTFDCSDLIGKVFDDQNVNGYQDEGEPGIPNVRIATVNGLLVTSDDKGRFHVACAAIPQADHGSNFVMKVDTRTLPTGYRITTENPRDVRLTRGKLTKINFGAALHQVVRIEISDAAFTADGNELKPEWTQQIDQLLLKIKEHPSVIRLAYRRHEVDAERAKQRTAAVAADIQHRWEAAHCCYPLVVEVEGKGVLP